MNITYSNIMATGLWTAFLSVLALIGIVVAGGFIVALFGRMVLTIFGSSQSANEVQNVDEFGYTKTVNVENVYTTQQEEMLQHSTTQQVTPSIQTNTETASSDYSYALDVDDNLAKTEEEALNNELNSADEDDFFNDFAGDNDSRFGDDDLMGMIDEISQDVLDEEEQVAMQAEREESDANKSILDKYSIDDYLQGDEEDNYLQDEELEDVLEEINDETINTEESVIEEMENIVDEDTINEINELKQQVKEIVESMEDNKNQNETFNEQLISILNELKEANKRDVKTEQDAEREIEELKQQLEDARIEMEEQLQARLADKDAEMQARLQQQLDSSNAEIEGLKLQLSQLLEKMENPDDDEAMEIEPEEIEEVSEIDLLRQEVKNMLDVMREETDAKNSEANAQILQILNEMKEVTLKQAEKTEITNSEDAIEEVDSWQEDLELAEKELEKQFKEEMLHKDEEEKQILRAQMQTYSDEISELKEQLEFLKNKFQEESAENQALINELEKERKERINLEQAKLAVEMEQAEQLERLRKENEELVDKLQIRSEEAYQPLTEDEIDDLYSETSTIDYSAISQMNEEQINQKVQAGLEDSKQEIKELKEQITKLADYIKERDDGLAEKFNVSEVRTVDFDLEQLKAEATKEVEERVQEKLIDSLAEISLLKEELIQTKLELENQYKEQLSNTEAGMEYEEVSKLQTSAEKIDELDAQLSELTKTIKDEQKNIKDTSEQCVAELETLREEKLEEVKENGIEEVAVVGPKNNQIALVSSDITEAETIEAIDAETVKQLTSEELDEIINARLQNSNDEIENLKKQIAELKQDLINKTEEIEKATTVPAVRSPLFDVEAIKKITAQEVEIKVQERLAEAMKEIEEMKRQLELSKKEIEKQYKEQVINNENAEEDIKAQLKGSAAEVIELKEQLTDLTEQITLEHQEAQQNSEAIAEQLEQDRKEKQEIARLQLGMGSENSELSVVTTEVTVIGPKDNQVALVTGGAFISEEIEDEIPTIDIETVKQLTEQEIEEKVQQRMASSTIEIEELKKQILNLSIQIQEIKNKPTDDSDDEKPMVFHYATEEAYLERLAILEERLKNAKKDLKINNKELNPLEKVNRTLERDKTKLRRKYAIAAKKKVALYGVNNYVDIDKEKAEKLAQELELLEGLKLSVSHCEEVMNANIDRYPILVHTDKILRENIANIESDIATLNKELNALRVKNGNGEINE